MDQQEEVKVVPPWEEESQEIDQNLPTDLDDQEPGEFLTIPIEFLKFTDDPYSDPEESKEVIEKIAESFKKVGVLQYPVVVRIREGYAVVFGRKRVRAAQKLGWVDMPCIVREMDDIKQRQAALVENLCRSAYKDTEHDKAMAELQDIYLAIHPTSARGVSGGLGRNKDREKPKPFAEAMAEVEEVTPRTIRDAIKRGKVFTDEDRRLFEEKGIPKGWQTKLAKVTDLAKKEKVLTLIKRGVPHDKAWDKVIVGKAPVYEGDEEQVEGDQVIEVPKTDAEWLAELQDSVRTKVNTQIFDIHAVLYRRIQDVLAELRLLFGRYEKQNTIKGRAGTIHHLPAIVCRFLKTAHPSTWQVCGACGGNGFIGPEGSSDAIDCTHCGRTGFSVPAAEVSYWARLGIRGPKKDHANKEKAK